MERMNAILSQSQSEAMVDGQNHMIYVAVINLLGQAVYPVGLTIRIILLNWTSSETNKITF